MTAQSSLQPAIAIILVDDDLIFRTGLKVWLSQQEDIAVVGEAERQRLALSLVEQSLDPADPALEPTEATVPPQVDVAIASLTLGQALAPSAPATGVTLVEMLRQQFPTLPILVFGPSLDEQTLAHLRRLGVNGFVPKSAPPDEWLRVLRGVAAGETYLPELQSQRWAPPMQVSDASPDVIAPTDNTSAAGKRPFAMLRRNIRQSGIRQMDTALAELLSQLEYPSLTQLDRLVIEGQCRELRVARWLVNQLLATPALSEDEPPPSVSGETIPPSELSGQAGTPSPPASPPLPSSDNTEPGGALVGAGVEAVLFDGVMIKINGPLINQSGVVLELDILRPEKKRDLLYVVIRQLMELLDDLRQADITPQQLGDRQALILQDLWQRVTDAFFGRYYSIPLESADADGLEANVVNVLSEGVDTAQVTILETIPYSTQLLAHLVFRTPLPVDSLAYAAGTPEAMVRAEQLLDHFMIQVGNSVVQPLLNQLGDREPIKQAFYDRSLMSSREVARFRNALSWRYRADQLVQTPTLIFESKYRLFTLSGGGITSTVIYAPRRAELESLRGIPFLVTLALEGRDAVAPQLRAVLSWVGSGLIYVLTEVLGRGIGLIIRGVIKGIGSAWQDIRLSRDADQRRL